ncbi:MAG: hypothetical protein AMXMBFR64_26890 [Myxococcales bacterium]
MHAGRLLLALALLAPPASAAPLDRTVQVQGTLLTSSGVPASGTFAVTLRLFPSASGGSAVFTQPEAPVTVAGGVFDAALGPLPPGVLEAASALWLEAQVGGDLLPRQRLHAVPYALVAETANTAATAASLTCQGCVAPDQVSFGYAAATSKGGAAAALDCAGCVDPTDLASGAIATVHLQAGAVTDAKVAFNYAGSPSKGGPAADLQCSGCVEGAEIVANAALAGNVTVGGTLATCIGGGACQVKIGTPVLRDAGDARLTIQAASGLRVRDAAGAGWAALEAGSTTVTGALGVTGDVAVSGVASLGGAPVTQGARLDVQGTSLVRGALVATGGTGTLELNENQVPMYAELPFINPNPQMSLWPDGQTLPTGYDQTERLTVARTSTDVYAGTYAADLTVAAGQSNGYIAQDFLIPRMLQGRRIRLSVAAKPVGGATSIILYVWQKPLSGATTTVFNVTIPIADGWHEYQAEGVVAADTEQLRAHVYVAGGAGKRAVVDAFTLYPVDVRGPVNLATEAGRVGVGTTTPAVKLDVAGAIRLGSEGTCSSATEGALRYNAASKSLELCDGASWTTAITGGDAPNDLITCRFQSSTYMAINGSNTISFTAQQCGGTLPDSTYRGVFAKTVQCGRDEDWTILQPGDAGGPGVTYWLASACAASTYATDIEVVFIKAQTQVPNDVITCRYLNSAFNQGAGSQSRAFLAADCGGILPDSGYLGMLSHASQCGSDEDWEVRWAGEPSGPGIGWWMGSACAYLHVGAVFARTTSQALKNAIVCEFKNTGYTAPNSPGNAPTVRQWQISECGGKLPDASYQGVQVKGVQCGADEDWAILDADEPGGPGISLWISSSCAGAHYKAVYLKR